jgi:hypothetical protein
VIAQTIMSWSSSLRETDPVKSTKELGLALLRGGIYRLSPSGYELHDSALATRTRRTVLVD